MLDTEQEIDSIVAPDIYKGVSLKLNEKQKEAVTEFGKLKYLEGKMAILKELKKNNLQLEGDFDKMHKHLRIFMYVMLGLLAVSTIGGFVLELIK